MRRHNPLEELLIPLICIAAAALLLFSDFTIGY